MPLTPVSTSCKVKAFLGISFLFNVGNGLMHKHVLYVHNHVCHFAIMHAGAIYFHILWQTALDKNKTLG